METNRETNLVSFLDRRGGRGENLKQVTGDEGKNVDEGNAAVIY